MLDVCNNEHLLVVAAISWLVDNPDIVQVCFNALYLDYTLDARDWIKEFLLCYKSVLFQVLEFSQVICE